MKAPPSICALCRGCAGLTVSDAEMETLHLRREDFHGEWNYSSLTGRGSGSAQPAQSKIRTPKSKIPS